jgi:hypothetical protein
MDIPNAVGDLERDLRGIFGARIQSMIVYGQRRHAAPAPKGHDEHGAQHQGPRLTHTLAVVDALSTEDLRACASKVAAWHDKSLATPLLVATDEFERSLDAFPFEFGAILSDHVVVFGGSLFEQLQVDPADLRRACEVQARGHLLHLREGYLETLGRGDRLAVLIVDSAAAFAALVTHVAQLTGKSATDVVAAARHVDHLLELGSSPSTDIVALAGTSEISSAEAERLFPAYLDMVEHLVDYLDGWK